jgi:peptide/nickel transport system permease protein
MIRYTIRRLLWGLLVLFIITVVTFTLFGPVLEGPGDTDLARAYAGSRATEQAVENMREYLNLDEPYVVQYGLWAKRLFLGPSEADKEKFCPPREECSNYIGRLGNSFTRTEAVDKAIKEAFPVTLSLVTVAAIIWLAVAIPVGVLSAVRSRSKFDRISMFIVLWGQALPVYYFGLLALYFLAYLPNSQGFEDIFGFKLDLFPIGGYVDFSITNPWPWLHHLILPAATLALQFTALYVRMLRSTMLTTMSEDYIRTARAKGVPERTVIYRHGLRNAILPIVTMFGLDLAILLGGSAILTETVFAIPGLGRLAVQGALSLDVALTAGVTLVAALLIVVANIIVDLVYAFVDPRIRLA